MRKVFPVQSVENIVAPLTLILSKLDRHAATQEAASETHYTEMSRHWTLALESLGEANKARSVRGKIAKLLD